MNGNYLTTETKGSITDSLCLTIYQYMKEHRTEIINARVTKRERIALKIIAKHHKKTISDLIREGINNYKKTTNGI